MLHFLGFKYTEPLTVTNAHIKDNIHLRRKNLKNLTSLLHGGRKHIFPRWQWHKEGEGDHPQADGEVCQHLDASQEQMKDYKTSIRDPVKAETVPST